MWEAGGRESNKGLIPSHNKCDQMTFVSPSKNSCLSHACSAVENHMFSCDAQEQYSL